MSVITPYKWGWGEGNKITAFWGWSERIFNPLAPKVIQPEAKHKVIHADNKPKVIQSINPFKAVAK